MTLSAIKPFNSNLEHLQAELALLDLRLLREFQRLRRAGEGSVPEEYRGLSIGEGQVVALLTGREDRQPELDPDREGASVALARREAELAERRRGTLETGETGAGLPLERLRSCFGLTDFEVGVLVLCLAPELDRKYETVFAYLQDDIGKKRPTAQLALDLWCDTLEDRLERRRSLAPTAPLVDGGLVHLVEDPYVKTPTRLSHFLALEGRVVDYLLGTDARPDQLQPGARLARPDTSWSEVVLPAADLARLQSIGDNLGRGAGKDSGLALQLVGPRGTGKKLVARTLSAGLGKPLLLVDVASLRSSDLPPEWLVAQVLLEARLQQAVLCLDQFHRALEDDARTRAWRALLARAIRDLGGVAIVAGETRWRPQEDGVPLDLVTVELPLPDYAERRLLWERQLAAQGCALPREEVAALVSKFRFSGGQIEQTLAAARALARWDRRSDSGVTAADVYAAARGQSNQRLEQLARRIAPQYRWEDLVLPPDQKEQLREICNCFKNLPRVYGDWGFQSKTSLGQGVNILFAGPSGTGKTMSAEIMAGELGLDLYKIDLSTIVSKYIGETEKNLDRIFSEAQGSNAILLFDEADSLFGKRSEVRDSHDRYANIEVSYLLQKMEEYRGITILTTNFRKNMDDAFVRRLQFAVEFPFPEEEYRRQIWQRIFPAEAPLAASVDLPFLARQFKLAGGNIKNIAVAAAFLGAEAGESIGMEHLIKATRREYQKLGKLLVESEFGPYFPLVRG